AAPAAATRTPPRRRGDGISWLSRDLEVGGGAIRLQRVADVQRQRALRRRDAPIAHQADDGGVVLLAVIDLLGLLGQARAQRADLRGDQLVRLLQVGVVAMVDDGLVERLV